jgi:hypothetical protein
VRRRPVRIRSGLRCRSKRQPPPRPRVVRELKRPMLYAAGIFSSEGSGVLRQLQSVPANRVIVHTRAVQGFHPCFGSTQGIPLRWYALVVSAALVCVASARYSSPVTTSSRARASPQFGAPKVITECEPSFLQSRRTEGGLQVCTRETNSTKPSPFDRGVACFHSARGS